MLGYEIEISKGGIIFSETTFLEDSDVEVTIRLVNDKNLIVDKKTLVKSEDNKIILA